MKFVKENLTLVICGAVVLLFLVFAFAPLPYMVPSLNAELADQMQQRWNFGQTIKSWANEPLELPGGIKDKGVPPQNWVDAKNESIKNMEQQQKQVEELAKQYNSQGRLDQSRVPILPLMSPNSEGVSIPGYLPTTTTDAMAYKISYGQLTKRWTGLLATGAAVDMEPEKALPQKAERLRVDWEESERVRIANSPGGGASSFGGGQNSKAERDYYKRLLIGRASGLQMYVMDTAFQVRDWYTGTTRPDETQIFESLVESWLQADVVKAIAAVNGSALKEVSKDSDRNVFRSPVKRLTRIVVGDNARNHAMDAPTQTAGGSSSSAGAATDTGALFFSSGNSGGGAGGAPVSVAAGNAGVLTNPASTIVMPETPNQTNYALGMTGRSAGKTYDVVYMAVKVEIDPAYLMKFIDQLYRQNMCYTVTNIQMRSVDPLARASEGFLYGDVPVVEVQMLVECLFFRSWTESVMPIAVKKNLGGVEKQPG